MNTLPSFELALTQGADGVELDVRLTRDGAMVIMHDDRVDATTDGEGRVGLPEDLVRHAQLDDAAAFVGLGNCFEIWEPRALELRKVQARRATAERRGQLRAKNGGGAP